MASERIKSALEAFFGSPLKPATIDAYEASMEAALSAAALAAPEQTAFCNFPHCDCSMGSAERCQLPAAPEAPREPSEEAIRKALHASCFITPGDNYDAEHPRVKLVMDALRAAIAVDFPAAPPAPAGDGWRGWAVERWNAEVANRPLRNVHRRTLDDTWRQVIRRAGGNPDELIGPSHDELLAVDPSQGWIAPPSEGGKK
jgi:hypothetical protein